MSSSIKSAIESEYGDLYKNHKLEQYKIFVNSAEKVSDRRLNSNKFFITINSLIVTLLGIFIEKSSFFMLVISIVGIVISVLWIKSIINYSELNSVKFKIINEIEDDLPLYLYKKEWDILGKNKKYNTLSKTEKYIPYIFICVYISLFFK